MKRNYKLGETITLEVKESKDDGCKGCFFFRGDDVDQGCLHNVGIPCIDNVATSEGKKLSGTHHPIFVERKMKKV